MATERIQRIIDAIGDERRRFELFCRSLSEEALPERAADPEMQAWLDHPAVTWYQQTMAAPARR